MNKNYEKPEFEMIRFESKTRVMVDDGVGDFNENPWGDFLADDVSGTDAP